ncbi:MAG: biotin--[acetyl-CoA-carboxylase] ligase [Pseudomonadota bacterium]
MITPAIQIVEETGSTNADLVATVRTGQAREGQWLVARQQTAGRGRQGREWFDGSGNFMGSTLVGLGTPDPAPATLSFVAALAVHDAVEEALMHASHASLKWPNDVLLGGGKLSGILLELVETHVVVGIGVNLKRAPELADRRTSAVADHGPAPSLEWFADRLALCFARRLTIWREKGLAAVLTAFLDLSVHRSGSPVTVHDTDGSRVEGAFVGLDETDGALRLRLADGSERVIRAGDIL